jgi:hypothetical protein
MAQNRCKPTRTDPGVQFIMGTAITKGKPGKTFYVSYDRDGKRYFEKAGRPSFRYPPSGGRVVIPASSRVAVVAFPARDA